MYSINGDQTVEMNMPKKQLVAEALIDLHRRLSVLPSRSHDHATLMAAGGQYAKREVRGPAVGRRTLRSLSAQVNRGRRRAGRGVPLVWVFVLAQGTQTIAPLLAILRRANAIRATDTPRRAAVEPASGTE